MWYHEKILVSGKGLEPSNFLIKSQKPYQFGHPLKLNGSVKFNSNSVIASSYVNIIK